MFQPLGVIFRIIKYESYKVLLNWLPTGSRGLQYVSYKISIIVMNTWIVVVCM